MILISVNTNMNNVRRKFTLKLSQDSGVVDQYIYSITIAIGLTHNTRMKSEALILTNHKGYILKIYLMLTP